MKHEYLKSIAKIFSFLFSIALLVIGGTQLFIQLMMHVPIPHGIWILVLEYIFPFVMVIAVNYFYWKKVERWEINKIVTFKSFINKVFIGFIIGFTWISIDIILLLGFDAANLITIEKVSAVYFDNIIIKIISLLLSCAMQELVVRGYLFTYLEKNYSGKAAIIFSSIIFTLWHIGAISSGIVAITNVLLAGFIFGTSLYYFKSILVPIIFHFMWNAFFSTPGFIKIQVQGRELLTGGTFGLDGGGVVLLVNLLLLVGLLTFKRYNDTKKILFISKEY